MYQPGASDPNSIDVESTNLPLDPAEILADFRICCLSREVSLLARREVLTGKAKFGITGDGKELPQVAMARAFRRGDFRSGYYRDQTFLFALGLLTPEAYFAQLYADPANDPMSGGRMMNAHFATPLRPTDATADPQTTTYNISADISSTAGQMARALGLALASKHYRSRSVQEDERFSRKGDEVSFVTIGDASTSEGVFWETLNAAAVQQVPLAVLVWDDGYGISVPKALQTAKGSISEVAAGFAATEEQPGFRIVRVAGWNYPELITAFAEAIDETRREHQPVLFHIDELTQPQGHSTSGSHERYKSDERLTWEREWDCLNQFEFWIKRQGFATGEELAEMRKAAKQAAREARTRAWKKMRQPVTELTQELQALLQTPEITQLPAVKQAQKEIAALQHPSQSEVLAPIRRLYLQLRRRGLASAERFGELIAGVGERAREDFSRYLYSEDEQSALAIEPVYPQYDREPQKVNGFQVLNRFFRVAFEKNDRLLAFGEDVGQIGGVNQSMAGLQQAFGKERVFDTGIREWTIIGQAIGLALRGLRPIAEIQYLDYLIYGLQPLTDDLATLRWRSDNQQEAPAIIRTRGHRLEGVWHSGSPLGMLVNALRGMYLCVPRDMTRAAGMYNTLLHSNDPGLVIESLNGYRLKEKLPANLGEIRLPLGQVDILRPGTDLTLLTYGSQVRIAEAACRNLADLGIEVELIDAQTLLPFDRAGAVAKSLAKTNQLLIVDEDVPGGASAYLLREVTETQGGFRFLDAAPRTLTASAHRPAYGSDGDYYSKPNREDIIDTVYAMMHARDPQRFVW